MGLKDETIARLERRGPTRRPVPPGRPPRGNLNRGRIRILVESVTSPLALPISYGCEDPSDRNEIPKILPLAPDDNSGGIVR